MSMSLSTTALLTPVTTPTVKLLLLSPWTTCPLMASPLTEVILWLSLLMPLIH